MLYTSKNGKKWIGKALEKFKAYANRAPILISDIVGTDKCVDGLFVIHENSKTKFFFPFDFDVDPKVWVHDIKEKLLQFYPRIIEFKYEDYELTPEQLARQLEEDENLSLDKVPTVGKKLTNKILYRIDKVQPFKDIFILIKEGSFNENDEFVKDETPIENKMQLRYKYNGSCVMFLNKYRSQKFSSVEEAGNEFFNNGIFVDELITKNS